MDYKKLYFSFVESWKSQKIEKGVYTEKHHIIPKSHGGKDESSNIVVLTYRQHVFAHKLLWKAYKKNSDYAAFNLMSGSSESLRVLLGKAAGVRSVESGLLDRIRPLANTSLRQEKLKQLQKRQWADASYREMMQEVSKRIVRHVWTEEEKQNRSIKYKKMMETGNHLQRMQDTARVGREAKLQMSINHSKEIIVNAERNSEYLLKTGKKSRYKFISPEGLVFDSVLNATRYYSLTLPSYVIDNWCKRSMHGWSRIPKPKD